MKKTLISIVTLIIIAVGIYFYTDRNPTQSPETTPIILHIQDKEVARTSDCGVTKKVTYRIPKTDNLPDTSLRILFEGELSRYGIYDSVVIANGIAKVMLQSDTDPAGKPLSALSSCEIGHLFAVIEDTLAEYSPITSVEIYSPNGKIEF